MKDWAIVGLVLALMAPLVVLGLQPGEEAAEMKACATMCAGRVASFRIQEVPRGFGAPATHPVCECVATAAADGGAR